MKNTTNTFESILATLNTEHTEVTVLTSPTAQRVIAEAEVHSAVSAAAEAERFTAFCTAAAEVGWCFTVNRGLLCGTKKNGIITSEGVGFTEAQWKNLSGHLTAFKYVLAEYISAERTHHRCGTKETKQRLKDVTSIAFDELKAIKRIFNIKAACSAEDVPFLAYRSCNLSYVDRDSITSGYTLKQCGTITLLNMVLRYTTAAQRIDTAVEHFTALTTGGKKAVYAALTETHNIITIPEAEIEARAAQLAAEAFAEDEAPEDEAAPEVKPEAPKPEAPKPEAKKGKKGGITRVKK